jgi:hypothetical protein
MNRRGADGEKDRRNDNFIDDIGITADRVASRFLNTSGEPVMDFVNHVDLGRVNIRIREQGNLPGRKGVFPFDITLIHEGKVAANFAVNTAWSLDIYHRIVTAGYQGMGLASLCMAIIESIAKQSELDMEADVVETDVLCDEEGDGIKDFEPIVVQRDVLEMLYKRGFLPGNDDSARLVEQVRTEDGFRTVSTTEGVKAVPKKRPQRISDFSLLMKKSFNKGGGNFIAG